MEKLQELALALREGKKLLLANPYYAGGGFGAGVLAVCYFTMQGASLRGTKREKKSTLYYILHRLIWLSIMLIPQALFWHLVAGKWVPWKTLAVILLLYLPSYLDGSERSGGRPSSWLISWSIWQWFVRRFNNKIKFSTKPPEPGKTYLFALHPHGILPFAGVGNFSQNLNGLRDKMPGIEWRIIGASFIFYVPIYRDLCLGAGMCDASRYSAQEIVRKGMSVALVPGGASEALYADPNKDVAYINKRFGFIKLAIEEGLPIVPVYSYNECHTYDQFSMDYALVRWIKSTFQGVFGISLPLVKNIIPQKCDVTTVIGDPIVVPHIEEPDRETVAAWLNVYKQKLVELFDKHKAEYNHDPESVLQLV